MLVWREATCLVFCSIAHRSEPSYLKGLQNLLPKDTQRVGDAWGAESQCKKRLLWKNHSGWRRVTSSHRDSAFSILLRTDHQARLTEIVKILAELNIIPVLLMPSTGQLKTKVSHATTSVHSKSSAKPQMIFPWMALWNTLFYFLRTSLHLTHSSWLSCTEHKLTFLQHKTKTQGKEEHVQTWCNSPNKASGAAESCILCWRIRYNVDKVDAVINFFQWSAAASFFCSPSSLPHRVYAMITQHYNSTCPMVSGNMHTVWVLWSLDLQSLVSQLALSWSRCWFNII